ncbi:MAG: c-type cytochrome [Verrucomicrobiaceae bacterium]|nr:c-type cytochrome [Verrucomicrobiaceae bacterium]
MKFCTLAFVVVVPALLAQEKQDRLVRNTEPLAPEQEMKGFHLPEGFRVNLFASEPMINKPINMAFDAKGRLWVSSTVEYPYAAAKDRWMDKAGSRVKDSRDAIKILEDTNNDGRADKVTNFADGLNIPTGIVPWTKKGHVSGCIAWSIPNIWYFGDVDGDDDADVREVVFGPLGYEKDTHGMCSSFRLGSDGWIYATHGFNNTSRFRKADGTTLELHSGNVFRFQPSGAAVELWSAGQVNPFGLCWDRYRNLYSADCHSNPVTQLLKGAVYPSFGKPHDGLGFAPVMCEHSHGSTGLCGIVYVDNGTWGAEWQDRILLGNCVTSRINQDQVTFTGSTPRARERPDFLTSDDLWFRPVDLQLGPDRALYVADFYNRIIGHYEVPLDHQGRDKERGRIWRITGPVTGKPAPFQPERAISLIRRKEVEKASLPELVERIRLCPKEDPTRRHVLRMGLRDKLRTGDAAFVSARLLNESQKKVVDDVVIAVATPSAAEWAHERLGNEALSFVVRNVSGTRLEGVVDSEVMNGNVALLRNVYEALLERGGKMPQSLLKRASALAEQLLTETEKQSADWSTIAFVPHPSTESPWGVDERKTTTGASIKVVTSLNKSRKTPEKLTGVLKSRPFKAPESVSFWICGHIGPPKTKPNGLSYVRLLSDEGKELKRVLPPRNDVCRKVTWDLVGFVGQTVRLEVTDGDAGGAYAWIGVGGLVAGSLSLDSFSSEEMRRDDLKTLASILRASAPIGLRDRLRPYSPEVVKIAPRKPQPELNALIAGRVDRYSKLNPDPKRGEAAFKAVCAVCHAIRGQGASLGPQLDGIGTRGLARLMEDILDPARNVDSHFLVKEFTLRDDSQVTGFVRAELGQSWVLVDAAGQERRISKGDVKSERLLGVSLMPQGFGQSLPEPLLADLVAWLLTQ